MERQGASHHQGQAELLKNWVTTGWNILWLCKNSVSSGSFFLGPCSNLACISIIPPKLLLWQSQVTSVLRNISSPLTSIATSLIFYVLFQKFSFYRRSVPLNECQPAKGKWIHPINELIRLITTVISHTVEHLPWASYNPGFPWWLRR